MPPPLFFAIGRRLCPPVLSAVSTSSCVRGYECSTDGSVGSDCSRNTFSSTGSARSVTKDHFHEKKNDDVDMLEVIVPLQGARAEWTKFSNLARWFFSCGETLRDTSTVTHTTARATVFHICRAMEKKRKRERERVRDRDRKSERSTEADCPQVGTGLLHAAKRNKHLRQYWSWCPRITSRSYNTEYSQPRRKKKMQRWKHATTRQACHGRRPVKAKTEATTSNKGGASHGPRL